MNSAGIGYSPCLYHSYRHVLVHVHACVNLLWFCYTDGKSFPLHLVLYLQYSNQNLENMDESFFNVYYSQFDRSRKIYTRQKSSWTLVAPNFVSNWSLVVLSDKHKYRNFDFMNERTVIKLLRVPQIAEFINSHSMQNCKCQRVIQTWIKRCLLF